MIGMRVPSEPLNDRLSARARSRPSFNAISVGQSSNAIGVPSAMIEARKVAPFVFSQLGFCPPQIDSALVAISDAPGRVRHVNGAGQRPEQLTGLPARSFAVFPRVFALGDVAGDPKQSQWPAVGTAHNRTFKRDPTFLVCIVLLETGARRYSTL